MQFEMQSPKGAVIKSDDRLSHRDTDRLESNKDTIALARSGKKQVLTVSTLAQDLGSIQRILIRVETIWAGVYDRFLLRIDVYLGRHSGVGKLGLIGGQSAELFQRFSPGLPKVR